MTDHETSVLSSRLHSLADDMAPPIDVVGQVRAARSRHSRQRRGRIALLAAAAVTAAVVVGSAAAADLLTATPSRGEVAVPSRTAPTTTEPTPTVPAAPSTTSVPPSGSGAVIPAGWEARSFMGMTFAVPPGARMADYVSEGPPPEPGISPEFIWNGPNLGGDFYSRVKLSVSDGYKGDLEYMAESDPVIIPGADQAYMWMGQNSLTDGGGTTVQTTALLVDFLAGDRHVHLGAEFVGGPEGEQMARDLVASFDLTETESGPEAGWESRSFQGVTFAVPPGARAEDTSIRGR